jgi:hypothetical protein
MKAILIGLLIGAMSAVALGADVPEGYEWASNKGALKMTIQNPDVYIFDTYSPLTIEKGKTVSWGVTKVSDLTDLGKELRGRLLKIDDVASVFVGYRVIMVRKFPLSTWEPILPAIKKALD